MRHRVLLGALLAAVVAVLAISGTAVAGQPIHGCTNSFSLIRANVDPVVDKNGDGWICTKTIGGSGAFNDIDNNSTH
ncbi:MAG TPA: hypothetical protein VGP54_07935 [Gaiellaceae bacterium]|nr:hypothetical protein [Gaiellaceae bacterium]